MGRLIVALLFVCAVVGGGSFEYLYRGHIYPRALAAGIDISGQSRHNAASQLETFSVKQRFREITLLTPSHRRVLVQAYKLGYSFDGGLTAWRAYTVGRIGSPWQRVLNQARSLLVGTNVTVAERVNQHMLRDYLFQLAPGLNRPPHGRTPGLVLDVAKAQSKIARALLAVGPMTIQLPFKPIASTANHSKASTHTQRRPPMHYHTHLSTKRHLSA